MSVLKQSFRSSYTTLALWFIAILFVCDVVRILIFGNHEPGNTAWFQNLDIVVANAVVIAAILFVLLRSEVTIEGLRSYNRFGGMEFVKWGDISGAVRKNFMGLGFYQIKSADGTCVYVPRHLRHQREFEMLVGAIIDDTNPLKQALGLDELPEHDG